MQGINVKKNCKDVGQIKTFLRVEIWLRKTACGKQNIDISI